MTRMPLERMDGLTGLVPSRFPDLRPVYENCSAGLDKRKCHQSSASRAASVGKVSLRGASLPLVVRGIPILAATITPAHLSVWPGR